MTEEDIHINGKRIAMTEREMIDVLKNELDYMMLMTHGSRLMLMNEIRQSLKCKSCYEDFTYRFLLNIHHIHLENFNLPCFTCSIQTSRFIIFNRRALLIDQKDNNYDGNNPRKRKVTLSECDDDDHIDGGAAVEDGAESAVAADDAEDAAEDAVGAAENAVAAEDRAESAVAADDAEDAAEDAGKDNNNDGNSG